MAIMDWSKEASATREVYPEGVYKVEILSFERVTASTGTPQIRWKGQIEGKGKLVIHTALTEKALWKIASLVQGCGIDVGKLQKMDTSSSLFDKILNSCVGRTSYWRLSIVADLKGNEKNEVEDFRMDTTQASKVVEESLDELPDFLKEDDLH